ncbi:MAG: hypothetical protein PHU63_01220 [Candidatus ainarchaeum sp.]|nr:hypothetical protein [Candidatus ainarchaeum sp.]
MDSSGIEGTFKLIVDDSKLPLKDIGNMQKQRLVLIAIQALQYMVEEQKRATDKNNPQIALKAFVFAHYLSGEVTIFGFSQELRERAFDVIFDALVCFDIDNAENAKFAASKILKALEFFDYGDEIPFIRKCINRLESIRLTSRLDEKLSFILKKLRQKIAASSLQLRPKGGTTYSMVNGRPKIRT